MNKTQIIGTEEENVYEKGKVLAERVNREAAEAEKAAARRAREGRKNEVESKVEQPPSLEEQPPSQEPLKEKLEKKVQSVKKPVSYLDKKPWTEDNEIQEFSPDIWIPKYNEAGRVMASAADYYFAAKLGDEVFSNTKFGIVWDLNKSRIVTSTKVTYNRRTLKGKIIHHYGSSIAAPLEKTLLIPNYSKDFPFLHFLQGFLDTKEGLNFVQALFGTDDDKEEILQVLERLSHRKRDSIYITIPSQKDRKKPKHRVVSLYHGGGGFLINATHSPSHLLGRSRGVKVDRHPKENIGIEEDGVYEKGKALAERINRK